MNSMENMSTDVRGERVKWDFSSKEHFFIQPLGIDAS